MSTFEISLCPSLREKARGAAFAHIEAEVSVAEHHPGLWAELERAAARYRGGSMEQVRRSAPIAGLRAAYRALGSDPTRYRGASEALVRRIVQGKDLYRVNTIVDINNLIALETLFSVGVFDLAHVRPPVVFRAGQQGEAYAGIGRGEINLTGLPVFADQSGPIGSTTSDSEGTKVTLATTHILMVVISFGGPTGLAEAAQRAAELLARYAAGQNIATGVVG
jgi:DNA/RNA-binding domain of Phe-tRNA-synthetase-like protein